MKISIPEMILISLAVGAVASTITWFVYGFFTRLPSAEDEHNECVRARENKKLDGLSI